MLARISSATTLGLRAIEVEIEVDISTKSMPAFSIVGLPGKAVEESKERVRSAIKNTGASLPSHKITVNLSPADLPKEGPAFDLPIALGLLVASEQISGEIKDALFLGELSLDGSVRKIRGVLPAAILAAKLGKRRLFVPKENAKEASIVSGIEVYGVKSLLELVEQLKGIDRLVLEEKLELTKTKSDWEQFDFAEIRGQAMAKRAGEIAVAGMHNMFMVGVPGAGKTMISRALATVMPQMSEDEIIEVTQIYSIAGQLSGEMSVVTDRPFRSPHHTTSKVGLIGGGTNLRPGEVSMAHRGILFLDELPEFSRESLESLRQPLEDGQVSISRASGNVLFPARFLMVGAANPCPCGYKGDLKKQCSCLPGSVEKYKKKLSGPLMDRIDLHVFVSAVEIEKLSQAVESETSESVCQRVELAAAKQRKRFLGSRIVCNGEMGTREIKKFCLLDSDSQKLLDQAANRMNLSARVYFRVIKVARTIADLEGEDRISNKNIAEALQYRSRSNEN